MTDEAHAIRREWGRRIAKRRGELGLSQRGLADRMAAAQSTVSSLETGATDLSLSTMQRVAGALDTSVRALFAIRVTVDD